MPGAETAAGRSCVSNQGHRCVCMAECNIDLQAGTADPILNRSEKGLPFLSINCQEIGDLILVIIQLSTAGTVGRAPDFFVFYWGIFGPGGGPPD